MLLPGPEAHQLAIYVGWMLNRTTATCPGSRPSWTACPGASSGSFRRPPVERLRGNRRLSSGLSAITAAVVGVVASLRLVVAVSVLFGETDAVSGPRDRGAGPGPGGSVALAVAIAAFLAMWRFRVNVVWVVLAAGAVGWASSLVG